MMLFLLQSALMLSGASAVAEIPNNITGHIHFRNGSRVLIAPDFQVYDITPANKDVAEDIGNLEPGDFLEGHGEIQEHRVVIEAVEFIGLRRLLGHWVDHSNKIQIDFNDFSNAVVKSLNEPKVTALQYALIPDQVNQWTIFLGDREKVSVGILTHVEKRVQIDVIDTETGHIEKTIRLQPLKN
jgi:hypothetical protein